MKARGCLVAALAVLIALAGASGALARVGPHRRHVEVRHPETVGQLRLTKVGPYNVAINFEQPDLAILGVNKGNPKTLTTDQTAYGTHFHGSLVGGTVRARFGRVGSIAVRFVPSGKPRLGRQEKGCEGPPPRTEEGSFVGVVSLRGEGGYFKVSAHSATGRLERTFRETCRVRHVETKVPPVSLRAAVQATRRLVLGSFTSTLASVLAGGSEGGREVLVRAAHDEGSPSASLSAIAFEYQGKMPVERTAWLPSTPAGTFVTTLPGEHPATAAVKGTGPFTGEAEYVGASRLSHEWTGDLTAHFPGLVQPLTGPHVYSSLCVVSTLVDPNGCEAVPPDWQGPEISPGTESGKVQGAEG